MQVLLNWAKNRQKVLRWLTDCSKIAQTIPQNDPQTRHILAFTATLAACLHAIVVSEGLQPATSPTEDLL
jgi:hypothetical protein